MEQAIEKLLDAIAEVTRADGAWKDKRDAIRRIAHNNQEWDMALEEFISWFPDIS